MTQEALKLALEALENNKLNHLYCEDTWYSCPKHEDGCANEAEGDECNCGADEVNAQFDNAITAIKKALAQPEQEHFALKHRIAELEGAVIGLQAQLAQTERPVDCERCNRLEDALKRANGLAEHFERAWYLRGDEIERLTAQPEQEPVAWMDADGNVSDNNDHNCFPIPLYTTPPRRKPLTDEEIEQVFYKFDDARTYIIAFARAIEAAHAIKE